MDLAMTWQSRSIRPFFLIFTVFQLLACEIAPEVLLRRAAIEGQIDAVKGPLSRGANVDYRKGGWTILMDVARVGHIDVANVLLEYGADVNARGTKGSPRGATPLTIASEHGRVDMVKLLLANGAEVNAKNNHGNTALMYAAEYGHPNIAKALLDAGADVTFKDNDGETALMIGERKGNNEIIKLIQEAEIRGQ